MNKVCAVVVAFHPPPALAGNTVALLGQVQELIIVDNGTYDTWPLPVREAAARPGVTLLKNTDNLGIATAFNQGLQYAVAQGYEWAATFDQDSQPPPGFIAGLKQAWQACPCKERVAVVAPSYWLQDTAPPTSQTSASSWRVVSVAMASGNLVRLNAAQSVGFMDDAYFIDYVDFDFCLRLRRQGWKVIQARNVCLPHRLGSREIHRLAGRSFSLVAHSPLRRYYNARNRLITYRRHALRFPGWFLHDLMWWGLEWGKILLFEKYKAAKMRAMWLGVKDALAGRMGPASSCVLQRLQLPTALSPNPNNPLNHG